jgi:probable dihydroxyacetone kinase regulator
MANSSITKQALASSLKKLMMTQTFNTIHVQMITDDCGVTRHTFYTHFQNIYDLLGWMYEHEVIEDLEQCCNFDHWNDGVLMVLNYTLTNRTVCLNTFHSMGRDHLEMFLYNTFSPVMTGIVDDITRDMHVDEKVKQETVDFYSNAIIGVFTGWLKKNMETSPEIVAGWIEQMVRGNIVRIMHEYDRPHTSLKTNNQ